MTMRTEDTAYATGRASGDVHVAGIGAVEQAGGLALQASHSAPT